MSRRQSFHEDPYAYLNVMREAFAGHYAAGTDMWSQDDSLLEAARNASAFWQQLHRGQRPRLLDIGCGNGRVFRILQGDLGGYTGVDLCEHPEWQALAAAQTSPAEFAAGDFAEWAAGRDGGAYDLVLDHGCLHHQHPGHQGAHLAGMVKLLAQGGMLSLVVWAESWKPEDIGEDGRFHLAFTREGIERMIAGAGLEIVQMEETRARVGTNQFHVIACKR